MNTANKKNYILDCINFILFFARVAQLIERLPSKQGVEGLRPFSRSLAYVAQLVEQLICNQQVVGSSPSIGSYIAM